MSPSSFLAGLPAEWNGSAFCVHVHQPGARGMLEFGAWEDVPRPLARLAAHLPAGVESCDFYWCPAGPGPICRTRVEARSEGASRYVLLTGEPVYALPHGLTRRELDVLTLVVAGMSNAGIAGRLQISLRTASTHVNNILHKLDTGTRTSAATLALEQGLLGVPLPGGVEGFGALRIGRLLLAAEESPGSRRPGPESGRRRLPAAGSAVPRRRDLLLGAVLPLTGAAAHDGLEMLRGIQLAVEEVNALGGVRGRLVTPEVVDADVGDAGSVRTAFEDVISRDVDVITSGYSAHQDVAHQLAAVSGIPYLHAATMGAMEERITSDPGRHSRIFQVCPSDVHYAPRFVDFMSALRDERAWHPTSPRLAVLDQSSWHLVDFGIARAARLASAQGWELEVVPVPAGTEEGSWAAAVAQAVEADAAAIMLGSYFVPDQVEAVRAVRATRSAALVYGIYAPSVPEFRERLGAAADGVLWATTTGTYSDQLGLAFARRFQRRFDITPGRSHAGIAYDRTHLIAQAWAMTDDFRDFDAVAERIRSTTYRGVNGSYFLDTPSQTALGFSDSSGDPSLSQAHLVYQVQQGRQHIISPAPYDTSRFQLPPWTVQNLDRWRRSSTRLTY